MKTSELLDGALNWAVAKCEGHVDDETIIRRLDPDDEGWCIAYSTDWAQGGAIIEREGMQLWKGGAWCASLDQSFNPPDFQTGTTPLVAAMRCYVASKLGDEVEIPEELLFCAHD